MRLLQRSVVYEARGRPPHERIAFFTSLRRLHSGTILAGFQLGRSKHAPDSTIRLCRSLDDGLHWTELDCRFERTLDGVPGSLAAAEIVEPEPGRLLLFTTWFDRSVAERPLFNPETEGILRSRQLAAESTDDGSTWSAWRELSTAPLTGCAMTGPALAWPDGTVAFAFESFKEYDDPRPATHGSWLLISHDGGRTFGPPWRTAQDPAWRVYFWDQRLAPGERPGEFFGLFWTHDRADRRDRTVHRLEASWREHPDGAPTLPVDTGMPGQIAAPLRIDSRRILALIVDRQRPATIKLWQSTDGGVSWPAAQALTVYEHDERAALTQGRENVDYAQFWEDMGKWSFGHPAVCRLPGRRALVAWYAGAPDAMSLHAAQVEWDE